MSDAATDESREKKEEKNPSLDITLSLYIRPTMKAMKHKKYLALTLLRILLIMVLSFIICSSQIIFSEQYVSC